MLSSLFLVALLVTSATSSPVGVGNKDGGQEVDDSSSDMLSILESLKGSNPMETLSNFVKQSKIITSIVRKVMLTSPLIKNLLEETAKQNVEARIVLKLANDQVPDVHDIYGLIHNRKKAVSLDFHNLYMDSAKYKKFMSLMHGSKPILDSATDADEFLDLFTGINMTFDPQLISQVSKRTYQPNPASLKQGNMLTIISFIHRNIAKIARVTYRIADGSSSFMDLLTTLLSIDVSQLSNIKEAKPELENDKYVVSGKQTLITDSDIVQILQDKQKAEQLIKQRSTDQSKAEELVADIFSHAINVLYRVTEGLRESQEAHSKTKMVPALG